jgi:antirestriction protein ArdC
LVSRATLRTPPALGQYPKEALTVARITYSSDERKARLESAHAELTKAVAAISTSDDWKAFLEFAHKMHAYSAQNRMWLFQQAMMRGWDDLGYVAGFRAWLALGRHVRKGEHGLSVLAPVRVKIIGEDGFESWIVRGFKVEHVFAARQTDGEGAIPEPIRPKLLTGEGPAGAWNALSDLVAARGFTVERAALYPANGQTSFTTRRVTVADRLDEAAAVKTLAHELAHIMLHSPDQIDYHADRERAEAEAESTAYLVCSELGLASDSYSFPYVASWAKGDTKLVTATADRVLASADEIIAALDQAQAHVAA